MTKNIPIGNTKPTPSPIEIDPATGEELPRFNVMGDPIGTDVTFEKMEQDLENDVQQGEALEGASR